MAGGPCYGRPVGVYAPCGGVKGRAMAKGILAAAVLAAGVIWAVPASANLSGVAENTTGSTCSGGGSADGGCRNSVHFSAAGGGLCCHTLAGRDARNINAGTRLCST